MKSRQCFVSNSSSSSFVIAEKPSHTSKCPHCGRCDKSILSIANDRASTWGATELFSVNSGIDEEFSNHFDWLDNDAKGKIASDIDFYKNIGYTVIAGSVSDHDKVVLDAINRGEKTGSIVRLL